MADPLVSVIVPVYNGEKYLAEAIDSILCQTYLSFEIIVVDDGSTDDTAKVAKQFPSVRYFNQGHLGQGVARNRAVREAKGNYFAFLDADDLWVKEKLALQMDYLTSHLEIDLVFGHVKQFYSAELKKAAPPANEILPGIIPSSMVIRREAFFKAGWFEETKKLTDFATWYAYSVEVGLKAFVLKDVVTFRRIHKTNVGILERHHRKDYVLLLKEHLDRGRNVRGNG
ncbi:MAG: glycosyltransferase family 2 protein [Candidatus Omnitrophica bacterium]|nr:glycosyltransferase family 2 protein [Candidatus Omnitrophota bacterium]